MKPNATPSPPVIQTTNQIEIITPIKSPKQTPIKCLNIKTPNKSSILTSKKIVEIITPSKIFLDHSYSTKKTLSTSPSSPFKKRKLNFDDPHHIYTKQSDEYFIIPNSPKKKNIVIRDLRRKLKKHRELLFKYKNEIKNLKTNLNTFLTEN